MALYEVRLDCNSPLKLHEAFLGANAQNKFTKGNVTGVYVDSTAAKFNVEQVAKPVLTASVVEGGVESAATVVKVDAAGLYGETIELAIVVTTFKDKVYKQERPSKATVELQCLNWDSLQYKPDELFVNFTAEFSSI